MAPSLSRGGQKEFGEGGRASRFGLARLWVTSDRLAMADQCPLLLGQGTLMTASYSGPHRHSVTYQAPSTARFAAPEFRVPRFD